MEIGKIISGILVIIAFICVLGWVGDMESTETGTAIVMSVKEDSMEIYDYNGHHWFEINKYKGDFVVGDEIDIKISNNGNDVSSDDEILSVNGKVAKGKRINVGYYENWGDPLKPTRKVKWGI